MNGILNKEEIQKHPVIIMQQHHIGTMFGKVLVGWNIEHQEYHIYAELHRRSVPASNPGHIRVMMNKNAAYQRQYHGEDKVGEQILFRSKNLKEVAAYAKRELGLRLQVKEG